jgi:gamma-glutamyltranspeptidase/glutathione hydrolase
MSGRHSPRVKIAPLAIRCLLAFTIAAASPLAVFAQEEPAAPIGTGGDLVGYGSIHHPTIGRDGMVVSQNKIAARIGADILRKGGNAVDASAAAATCWSITPATSRPRRSSTTARPRSA